MTQLATRPRLGAEPSVELDVTPEAPAALEAVTRAEIDMQIATAKRYPRSFGRVYDQVLSLATLNQAIAQRCFYALPRDGKTVTGPSVRLAEILANCWGNLRTSARITQEDSRFVTAQAVCLDMETNNGVSVEVRRRITTKEGRKYGDDMIITTSNAAISIAFRNAVLRVVPRTLVDAIEAEVRACAAGKAETFGQARAAAFDYFLAKGVNEGRILAALDAPSFADVDLTRLHTLQGFRTALEDGEATVETLFPAPVSAAFVGGPETVQEGSRSDALLNQVAKKKPVPTPWEPGADG